MEEDPKDHDFDQRHDVPVEQTPTVNNPKQRAQTVDFGRMNTSSSTPKSFPSAQRANSNPTVPPVRHSTQLARDRRTSRDFDRRVDGPFGRPSLTMSRRRSESHAVSSPPGESIGGAAVVGEEAEGEAPGDVIPASMETLQSSDPAFEPEPPPLNYTLYTRKMSITIFWSLVLIDSIAMPIVLYFCLWYLTDLSPNTVFSIVTAALGGVSILEYVLRFWRLWKHSSTCRVIGARRAYLDWFHWNFSAAWFIVMVELIVYVP